MKRDSLSSNISDIGKNNNTSNLMSMRVKNTNQNNNEQKNHGDNSDLADIAMSNAAES